MKLSRRHFAATLAASPIAPLLAQQPPALPAAAPNPNTSAPRRGPAPEIPPFQEPLSFARADVQPKVRPFPMTQVRLLAGPLSGRLGMESRLHGASPGRSPGAQFSRERRTAHGRETVRRMGATEQRASSSSRKRAARPLHRSLSFGERTAVCVDRRSSRKSQRRRDRRRAREVPGETQRRISECLPHRIVRSAGRRESKSGRRFTPFTRSWPGMFDMYQLDRQQTGARSACRAWPAGPIGGPHRKSEEHMQDILNTEYGGMNEVLYNLAAVDR